MKRPEVLQLLAEHRDELTAMGVKSLAVFGSVARDEAGPDSDVDLLVEFEPSARVGIFRFLDIQEYLERVLGRPVDLVARGAVKRQLREQILREAIPVATRSRARDDAAQLADAHRRYPWKRSRSSRATPPV